MLVEPETATEESTTGPCAGAPKASPPLDASVSRTLVAVVPTAIMRRLA